MSEPGFWEDRERSEQLGRRRGKLELVLEELRKVEELSEEASILQELHREGETVEEDLLGVLDRVEDLLDGIEMKRMLSGEQDSSDAILSIHPGAGGTESQDWAKMLYRMYIRWAERHGYGVQVIDYQDGEEAGLKSATLLF